MLHQALNRENDNILIEFDRIADLITELIDLCLGKNNASLDFDDKTLVKVKQEVNDYQIAFDLSLAKKIQDEIDEIMVRDEKPEISPDYIPPPLLIADEILNETTKRNEEFVKTSLAIRDEEIKAENEIADQKMKKLIKDIIDPTPGIFVNDNINFQDINVLKPNTTDNTYKLKPDVQKQLHETNDDQESFYNDDDLSSFVFAKDETDSSSTPVIKLDPPKPETNNQIDIVPSDEKIQVTKSLNNTDVEMTSKPTTSTYTKTTSAKNRPLKKVKDHPNNLKNKTLPI